MKQFFALWLVLLPGLIQAQTTEIFAPSGVALNGYDVVAFFDNHVVKGSDSLSVQWKGVKWHFATAAHQAAFLKNPAAYEPQYGGYCAFGASRGYKAATLPDTWALVGGKLYFNFNSRVKTEWNKNQQRYIELADAQWPAVKLH